MQSTDVNKIIAFIENLKLGQSIEIDIDKFVSSII